LKRSSVDCNELNYYMGDAIDGILPEHIKKLVQQHLHACRLCRTSYAFERLGKELVRNKIQRVTTPIMVREEILQALRHRSGEVMLPERFFPLPALGAAAAVLAIAIVLTWPQWFFQPSSPSRSLPNDIISQSLRNFALVRSGELKPAKISCTPEAVSAYFQENGVSFIVNVRPLENCDWYGALLSDHNGTKLAHVVYKVGDHLMYTFQLRKEDVRAGGLLHLPASAEKALEKNGWWIGPDEQDQSVVLWTTDGTLCTAVSSMKKERLLALLTSP
jgi:hypothetical protein